MTHSMTLQWSPTHSGRETIEQGKKLQPVIKASMEPYPFRQGNPTAQP